MIDQRRESSTSIELDESIVILGRRHNSEYETEEDFVDCVGNSINKANESDRVKKYVILLPKKIVLPGNFGIGIKAYNANNKGIFASRGSICFVKKLNKSATNK